MSTEAERGEKPPLSKKEKGRLKKLRKRKLEVKEGCQTSGIASNGDWLEWQSLQREQQQVIGPSVRLRKLRPPDMDYEKWPRSEGSDHLQIVRRFFLKNQHNAGKKRAQDSFSQSVLPSWATLRNPASTDSVAVLEIQLEKGDSTTLNDVMMQLESIRTCSMLPETDAGQSRIALPLQALWFQGNHPREMADSLFYRPNKEELPAKRQKKGNDETTIANSTESLFASLVLSREQREKEGYPLLIGTPLEFQQDAVKDFLVVAQEGHTLFPLSTAKNWVNRLKVAVIQDNTTNGAEHDHIQTLPLSARGESEPRIFAMDCEMVKTEAGPELARITLLQMEEEEERQQETASYKLVMDELVKPNRPILDYLTNYSGMTAKGLENVSTRLEQIQASVLGIVGENDILIGHSLENDLRAVRIVHNKVVDTSVLFRGSNSRKYSLRHLSATLLGKQIQTQAAGHCSEEDAAAALNLAVRRARLGSSFGILEKRNNRIHLLQETKQPQNVVCVGPSDWLRHHVTSHAGHAAHALTCDNVLDANTKAIEAWLTSKTRRRASLVWANLVVNQENKHDMSKLNELLSSLTERLLPGTILFVALQQGYGRTLEMSKRRKACRDPRSTAIWTQEQEETWQRTVDQWVLHFGLEQDNFGACCTVCHYYY